MHGNISLKRYSEKLHKIHRKTPTMESFSCNYLKRLHCRCFCMSFAKFLEAPIQQNTCEHLRLHIGELHCQGKNHQWKLHRARPDRSLYLVYILSFTNWILEYTEKSRSIKFHVYSHYFLSYNPSQSMLKPIYKIK